MCARMSACTCQPRRQLGEQRGSHRLGRSRDDSCKRLDFCTGGSRWGEEGDEQFWAPRSVDDTLVASTESCPPLADADHLAVPAQHLSPADSREADCGMTKLT